MGHPVIPAPTRFDAGDGPGFAFRPGTVIAYADAGIAPLVGRFCAQVTRRTGLRLTPVPGDQVPDEPSVTIQLAAARDRPPSAAASRTGRPSRTGRASHVGRPLAGRRRPARRALLAGGRGRSGAAARGGTGRRRARPDHADPAGSRGAVRQRGRDPGAGRADPRRAAVRLARPVPRRGPHVLHRRGDPAGNRPAGALQAQRAAPAPDRRPGLAPRVRPAGRQPGARRRLLPRRRPHRTRRLRRGPLRHDRARGRHARARLRAAGAAAGPEVRPERGRVRVPARPPPPRRVARPGAARDLRADGAGPGRGGRDLPGPLPAHRRGRAPRDAG